MTLPKKPESVKLAERERKALEKKRKALEKPPVIGGYTIQTIPQGRYRWAVQRKTEWTEVPEDQHNSIDLTRKDIFRVTELKPGEPGGEGGPIPPKRKIERRRDFYTGECVWEDPHEATRKRLQEAENKRYNEAVEINEKLGKPFKPWKRTGKTNTQNRPGTRTGATILTGGLGRYDDVKTKKAKLGA